MQVMALEVTRDHLLEIPDSPAPVPVLLPVLGPGSMLVEINDRVDDEVVQVIAEDQVEGVVRRR